jgi:universal stress protein E
VKETHHHSLIKRTLITNTDWHLLRDCAAPVLLVKANHWSNRIRVLACVDPGHHADVAATFDHAILAWAAGLRTTLEGDLHVLHSYLPVVLGVGAVAGGMPVVDGGVIQEIIDTERTVQAAAVLSLVQTYDVPLANIHVPLGSPADTIQQDAESLNIDIVVMGAISRTALKRILIGSTAERTLDRLPCDVLVVKPLDFAADLPF